MNNRVDLPSFLASLTGSRLPRGCDRWGVKSVAADGGARGGMMWRVGESYTASNVCDLNGGAAPAWPGDGLCLASTFEHMASGASGAANLLLCAYSSRDLLGGEDEGRKVRVSRVTVVASVDGVALVREHAARLDLTGADLHGFDLAGADLRGALLHGADLGGADLRGANLDGVNLRFTSVVGALR